MHTEELTGIFHISVTRGTHDMKKLSASPSKPCLTTFPSLQFLDSELREEIHTANKLESEDKEIKSV